MSRLREVRITTNTLCVYENESLIIAIRLFYIDERGKNMSEKKYEMINVIYVEPGRKAHIVEMEDSLGTMQSLVGGMIEEYMPFYDENDPRVENVAIVCDDEGKMKHAELNRAIRDNDGNIQDVIAGPFFICYAPIESENFESLPKDLQEKFIEKFKDPEIFFWGEGGLRAEKFYPDIGKNEVETAR